MDSDCFPDDSLQYGPFQRGMIAADTDRLLGQNVELNVSQNSSPLINTYNVPKGNEYNVSIILGSEVLEYADIGDNTEEIILIAKIAWGLHNALFDAEIDIRNGTTLCIGASTVTVKAVYENIKLANGSPNPIAAPRIIASGGIYWSSGSHQDTGNLTRTFPRETIEAGGVATFEIPKWAARLRLLPTVATGLTVNAEFLGASAANGLLQGIALASELASNTGAYIPGFSRFVRLRNTGGAPQTVSPVFTLGL